MRHQGVAQRRAAERTRSPPGDRREGQSAPSPPVASTAHATIVRVAIVGLFVIAVLHTLDFAHAVLIPIVAAILLGTVLSPIVDYLDRRHVPAPVSAALLVAALVLVIAGIARGIAEPLSEWLDLLPATMNTLWRGVVHWWSGVTHKMGIAAATGAANAAVSPQVTAQGLSWTGSLMVLLQE